MVVKQDNRIIKSFSFPIEGHIVAPFASNYKEKNLKKVHDVMIFLSIKNRFTML